MDVFLVKKNFGQPYNDWNVWYKNKFRYGGGDIVIL